MFHKRFLTFLLVLGTLLACDEIPEMPNPQRLVNDFAGIFTKHQVDSLERVLVDFDNRTTNQICVVSVKTLGGQEVDEFGLRLANKWGIGTKERQNGVLVLIKPRGRDNNYIDVTIQVGRGLEGAIPDVYAARIIRNIMGPYLKRDDYWSATSKACTELMGLAAGEFDEPHSENTFRNHIANFKHKTHSWIKGTLHQLYILLLISLGLGLVILLISLFHKEKPEDKPKRRKKKKDSSAVPPIVDTDVDTDSVPKDHGHHSGGFGGFGGLGEGGFGGGGASGRF